MAREVKTPPRPGAKPLPPLQSESKPIQSKPIQSKPHPNDAGLDGIERASGPGGGPSREEVAAVLHAAEAGNAAPRAAGAAGWLKAQAAPLCSNCKFWDQGRSDPAQMAIPAHPTTRRLCRRYPVELFKEPSDWCGEFIT
jgi:hypothetical protein